MEAPVPIYALKNGDIIGKLLDVQDRDGKTILLCQQVTPAVHGEEVYLSYPEDRWRLLGMLPANQKDIVGTDKEIRWKLLYYARVEERRKTYQDEHHGGVLPYREEHWLSTRAAILARDHYTCQRCGNTEENTGRPLHVHHIIRRRSSSSNEEASDPDNLITLCCHCHPKIESEDHADSESIRMSGLLYGIPDKVKVADGHGIA